MIAQLRRLRQRAAAQLEEVFPTTIVLDGRELAAARWSASRGAAGEDAGLLPVADVSFRVRRELLDGLTITPGRTTLVEYGVSYRVARVRSASGDPALVLECLAV